MCGIAGILDLNEKKRVSPRTIDKMITALAHRGPDGEGVFLEDNIALAHRRLAIIDPGPSGDQPMISQDKRLVVCYNGTIYNYHSLRSRLEKNGHHFRTNCDTEVLIHGWERWGVDIVYQLNGHFVFVIWDRVEKKLYIVRDRFGVKPLYYCNQGGRWLFASEIKGIIAHPGYSFDINYDALCEYFTFQNLFRFHTLFKDINLVPPANILEIDARSSKFKRWSYWDFNFSEPDDSMTFEEAKEETQRLMVQAVKRQLFSDVPVGSYLSGGMDSGSIVSIASKEKRCFHTFTCGWHLGGVNGVEASFDERAPAEMMAYLFKTQHYEQVVGHADVTWALRKVIKHLEDLRLGMSYGNYYIARLASKFVKVCFSGAGGDELFGGYPWRYYRVSHSLGKEDFFNNYYNYWQRLVPDEKRGEFFTAETKRKINGQNMQQVLSRVFTFNDKLKYETTEDHIANSLYFEAKTFLHGLLILGDKLSMAHGLDERFPFLDNDLCDFAQKIPVKYKLRNIHQYKKVDENIWGKKQHYFKEHNDGKNVLRAAMKGFIPEEVTNRKKQGFSSPDESWYRGPNLPFVQNVLLGKNALCHDFISKDFIRKTLEEHCWKLINRRLMIWSLLSFEKWLNVFYRDAWSDEEYKMVMPNQMGGQINLKLVS